MAKWRNVLADEPAWRAATLLRAARVASLATQGGGQPYAALVTPAIAPDGAALILLSGLSEHTAHLRLDNRCALLVVGDAAEANPQTAPRITLLASASPTADVALRARWLAIHPYAAFYADLPDFTFWRLAPLRAQFVAGFGSAHALSAAELAPDPAAVAALLADEPEILAHCNRDHHDALNAIVRAHAPGGASTGWRMVTADVAGCDLANADRVVRIPWSAPATNASRIREQLIGLAQAARQATERAQVPL